jgi:hypothetical protein
MFIPLTINRTVAVVPLTKGRHAIIDAADWPIADGLKWCLWGQYAARSEVRPDGTRGPVYLHRLVAKAAPEFQVDHINRNKLDNRRANLRPCTPQQNMQNKSLVSAKSGFKGVTPDRGKWKAYIEVGGRHINLGRYDTPEEAAYARDAASKAHEGKFAVYNLKGGAESAAEVYVPDPLRRMRVLRKEVQCPKCGRVLRLAGLGMHLKACRKTVAA